MHTRQRDCGSGTTPEWTKIGNVSIGIDDDEVARAEDWRCAIEHNANASGCRSEGNICDINLSVGCDGIGAGGRDSAIKIHAKSVGTMIAGSESISKNLHKIAVCAKRRHDVGDALGFESVCGGGQEKKKRHGREDTSEIHLNPLFKNSAFLPAPALCRFPLKA
jgi:hypothetical protein